MDTGSVAAYMIHIAEGITTRAHDEFVALTQLGLVRPETVIIHGTALTPDDFMAVGRAGGKLVWSPSSNMVLYGQTTDVSSAIAAGVPVSIAPDWTPSGEDTMLPELRFAKSYLAGADPGLFSDRELLEAVTRVPASNMSIDNVVGTLEVGKFADLIAVTADETAPYASAIEARSQQFRLVMVGGVPHYGDPAIVGAMRETPASCHALSVCNVVRRVCWDDPPNGAVSPESIAEAIRAFYPWACSPASERSAHGERRSKAVWRACRVCGGEGDGGRGERRRDVAAHRPGNGRGAKKFPPRGGVRDRRTDGPA
jgi:hypothetical protein